MSKFKKFLTLALAIVMTMSLGAPAFADDGPVAKAAITEAKEWGEQTTEIPGSFYTPTLQIQVSETGKLYVNPTKMLVTGVIKDFLDGTANLSYSFENQEIISTPIVVRNDSTDVAVKIAVTQAWASAANDDIVFKDTITASNPTEKEVLLKVAGNGTTPLDVTSVGSDPEKMTFDQTKIIGGTALKAKDNGTWANLETTATVGGCGKATGGDNDSITPSYGFVVVTGDLTETVAGWSKDDAVNITLVMSYVPVTSLT